MNILIINGSPKGFESISVQTSLYLKALNPQHIYKIINVSQKIKVYEKNFDEVKQAISWAELIIFSYPVYIFLAPYGLTRFMELLDENNVTLKNKNVTQITTSKHFYDVTAHKWLRLNVKDRQGLYYQGLSADMDDLLTKKGQKQASDFFKQLMFDIKNQNYDKTCDSKLVKSKTFISKSSDVNKKEDKTIVIVSCYDKSDTNIIEMIKEFKALSPYNVKEYNIFDFPFQGSCLGCFNCSQTGHCVYSDGFENFLRENVLKQADGLIYAYPIKNHFSYSKLKEYDDRQFCNGHRMLAEGTPIGYLLSGNYSNEFNLQMVLEGRSEVGGTYLAGIATDENKTSENIANLVKNMTFAMENDLSRPTNFYGVGGGRIFRDLVYEMRGLMSLDHKHYKKTGVYKTFPQKHKWNTFKMQLVGLLMKSKHLRKNMKSKMNKYIIMPYQKVIKEAKGENNE